MFNSIQASRKQVTSFKISDSSLWLFYPFVNKIELSLVESKSPTRVPICVTWHIMGKHDVIHKTGSTQHIAASSEDDQATATRITYRKIRVVFEICRRTDIQTRSSQNFSPLPGEK